MFINSPQRYKAWCIIWSYLRKFIFLPREYHQSNVLVIAEVNDNYEIRKLTYPVNKDLFTGHLSLSGSIYWKPYIPIPATPSLIDSELPAAKGCVCSADYQAPTCTSHLQNTLILEIKYKQDKCRLFFFTPWR